VIENDTLKANISFSGISIHYTTDDTEPGISSPVYESPIKVDGKVLIRHLHQTDDQEEAGMQIKIQ
jgi:hypothetical protein